MNLVTPLVNYTSIQINNIDIALSSTARVSFTPPYNRIDITFVPTNCSLSYYEVRVTEATTEEWDIDKGVQVYWDANVAANSSHSFSINVNSTNFSAGDTTYRVGLYARSSVDNSWDITYIFFTLTDGDFTLSDGSTFNVLTDRDMKTD